MLWFHVNEQRKPDFKMCLNTHRVISGAGVILLPTTIRTNILIIRILSRKEMLARLNATVKDVYMWTQLLRCTETQQAFCRPFAAVTSFALSRLAAHIDTNTSAKMNK